VLKLLAWRWGVAVAAVIALPWLIFFAERAACTGHVLRGVWVGNVSLAGLDRDAARQAIRKLAERLENRTVNVRVGDQLLAARATDFGFAVDADATADRALATGRVSASWFGFGWWVSHFSRSSRIAPIVRFDPAATNRILDRLQEEGVTDPPFDGDIAIENGQPIPRYPRRGYIVDREASRQRIVAALATEHAGVIDLPLVEAPPRLERATVDAAVRVAKKLLKGDVYLLASDADDEVTLTAADLAKSLATRPHVSPRRYLEVYFDAARLDEKLKPVREKIERAPVDATFRIGTKDEVHVVPDRPGVRLDPKLMADAILYAAASPGRKGILPLDRAARAELTTDDARALGIKELVSQFTTFHPCCRPRVKNIHRIADLLDGVIVQPGEAFSVNDHVGPRTRKNGFVPAPTIELGEMVDSLGGGISQFATTMFNAVLHGGYEIIERQPHSYYFSRYPMGHEATLSYPKPDLKFRNDTKAGMLIKCEYGKTFIRVRIFGDKEGRQVTTQVGRRSNIKQPPVEYIPNAQLDPEKEEVAERGQIGWTVIVSRKVRYADGEEKEEKRKVVYSPRVRRLEVHPCRIPEGEEGYTGEDCPVPEDESETEEAADAGDGALDSIEPGSELDEGF
jgi:vancomycin resistance protein YoaR